MKFIKLLQMLLTMKMILDFRKQAVSSAFIKEIEESISGNISAAELIEMRHLGVSRKFIDELNALGYERLTADQLINMKKQGVKTAFVEKNESAWWFQKLFG